VTDHDAPAEPVDRCIRKEWRELAAGPAWRAYGRALIGLLVRRRLRPRTCTVGLPVLRLLGNVSRVDPLPPGGQSMALFSHPSFPGHLPNSGICAGLRNKIFVEKEDPLCSGQVGTYGTTHLGGQGPAESWPGGLMEVRPPARPQPVQVAGFEEGRQCGADGLRCVRRDHDLGVRVIARALGMVSWAARAISAGPLVGPWPTFIAPITAARADISAKIAVPQYVRPTVQRRPRTCLPAL
jgi:hypothetical protein